MLMSIIDHLPLKILLLLQHILASPQIWDLPIFHTVIVTIANPFCALACYKYRFVQQVHYKLIVPHFKLACAKKSKLKV